METLIADGSAELNSGMRLAIPGFGRTLAAAAEERGQHIRRAVRIVATELESEKSELLLKVILPLQPNLLQEPTSEPAPIRCAWALVNMWLLGRSSGALGADSSLADAESWFVGDAKPRSQSAARKVSARAASEALAALSAVRIDADFHDLLPYILEAHGPGSRLSVMRDAGTRAARIAKKERGVFYTPLDVAEYMVGQVLDQRDKNPTPRSFDPACGTGAFLVTLLRKMDRDYHPATDAFELATRCLFGADISPLAVESCIFVLLHECMPDVLRRGIAPINAWHSLRLNFAAIDTLRIENCAAKANASSGLERARLRKQLEAGEPVENGLGGTGRLAEVVELQSLFPEARQGFDVLVGNPPYAALGAISKEARLPERFASLAAMPISGAENVYTLFVELMWKLTRADRSAAALVVPLSIAYSQRSQFEQCRRSMSHVGGRWYCSFFDREPHALFGEDVKTRNAILVRKQDAASGRDEMAFIHTGPLRKWTSRSRAQLFDSIAFTAIGQASIESGIPKLGNDIQASAYAKLRSQVLQGEPLWDRIRKAALSETAHRTAPYRVFVAGTAYNFLNVFRALSPDKAAQSSLSESGLHCVECSTDRLAKAAFALLSSRLVFWLWHVEGDGFHVSRGLLESLPFGMNSFTDAQLAALSRLGGDLWQELQQHQIVSVNKGKTTFAFRPLACEDLRDDIDSILLKAAGLPDAFRDTLRAFVTDVVVVDKTDLRRNHAMEFFVREDYE